MDITGNWSYSEDFAFGTSIGEVNLIQNGTEVQGTFVFTEKVENDYEIRVTEEVKGTISEGKVLLESTSVTAIQDNQTIPYIPNNFEIHLVSENKLVGSTFDSENVCGVFVMERKK